MFIRRVQAAKMNNTNADAHNNSVQNFIKAPHEWNILSKFSATWSRGAHGALMGFLIFAALFWQKWNQSNERALLGVWAPSAKAANTWRTREVSPQMGGTTHAHGTPPSFFVLHFNRCFFGFAFSFLSISFYPHTETLQMEEVKWKKRQKFPLDIGKSMHISMYIYDYKSVTITQCAHKLQTTMWDATKIF